MGGAGKTALARNIYESSLVKEHFDIRCWATISHEYDMENIILQLLPLTNGTELGERLYKSLSGKRYLIILDDVWSLEVWDCIKSYFPDTGNGSRVVVTTRLSGVATHLSSVCIIRINLLDEHKSWILFCQEVFGQEDCPLELVKIGKEIVKECKGLPLSIVVTGGLLRKSHRTREYWEDIANNIKSLLYSSENGGCLDALYLSYSHLPTHLKPCFLYMGTFKEDDEIRVSKIIKLWVAEGFLKPNGAQLLEETAEDYLKELIDRNLILISEHRSNGKIKSCRIHDLLRELCLRVGEKEKFFRELRVQSVRQDMDRERRLIFHDTTSSSRNSEVFRAFQSASLARSLLCNVSQVPDECRLLRVLKRAFHWSTEAEHQLVNLRYISYYANWDGSMFPSSMHLIWCLQTLIIKRRNMRTVSPLEIWKMAQLRHVKGSQIYVPDPPLSGEDDDSVVLRNLQTLIKVVNFRFSEEACKRIPNIKKLHLMYGDIWKGYDDGLYETIRNLSRLHKLESLNIGCSETTRIYISELENTFPSSLNELSLEDCHFHWGDLSTIVGSLPQLEVLELRGPFIDEHKWSCIEGSFVRLKVLEIRNGNLYYWSLESASCFPVLEKLVLVEFSGLMEIPSSVGEISTLQLIRLEHCSECLAISALKIKEEQESYGNDGLLVQVRMSGEVADSLRERVKKEGLSISNFQLLDNWKAKFAVS